MFDTLAQMLSYGFMIRALVVGALVSLCSALLGVSLVLKRLSMLGDGLSHISFGVFAVAAAFNAAPLALAAPVVILAAFLILRGGKSGKTSPDAVVALISAGALAVGVMIISFTGKGNIDMMNYLFGSILAIGRGDLLIGIILAALALTVFVLFYNKIFAVVFDENFARATGVGVERYNALTAILTSVTVVVGMRMMGALLLSGLITFPVLTAMRICKTFKSVTICSGCVAVASFVLGLVTSAFCAAPTGACVVVVNIAAFLAFSAIVAVKKFLSALPVNK
ncbi:MAG: metal ABC transporter permease [Oscillospiraceae bacterium]|jgi:zinc transport system permease protein|nr:metal ABC transporter permease [Oscillospiraceae bacterium]